MARRHLPDCIRATRKRCGLRLVCLEGPLCGVGVPRLVKAVAALVSEPPTLRVYEAEAIRL